MTHISLSGGFSFKGKLLVSILCVCVCVCAYMCVHVCVCMHVCMYTCMHVYICMYILTCLKFNGNVFIVLKGYLDNIFIHLISGVFCSHYRSQILFPNKLQNLVKLVTETKHISNLGLLFCREWKGNR